MILVVVVENEKIVVDDEMQVLTGGLCTGG